MAAEPRGERGEGLRDDGQIREHAELLRVPHGHERGRAHPAPVARATRASKAARPRHTPDVLVGAHAVRSDRMRIVGG